MKDCGVQKFAGEVQKGGLTQRVGKGFECTRQVKYDARRVNLSTERKNEK